MKKKEELKNGAQYEGKEYIFISYRHEDEDVVMHDLSYFENAGVNFWVDSKRLEGSDWRSSVRACLQDPLCVGACFYISKDSIPSKSIMDEIGMVENVQREYKYDKSYQATLANLVKVKKDAGKELDVDTERDQIFTEKVVEALEANRMQNPRRQFSVTCIPIGCRILDLLEKAKPKISKDNLTHYYETYLRMFANIDSKVRGEKVDDTSHLDTYIRWFDAWGVRDQTKGYSLPQEFDTIPYQSGLLIVGYHGKTKHPVVPSHIDGMPVLAIGNEVFERHSEGDDKVEIVGITIQEGVKIIQDGTFRGCKKLTVVNLPASLEEVGYEAFRGCTMLPEIKFHKSIKNLGDYCFYQCESLHTVKFEVDTPNFNRLGFNCFQGCLALTDVTLPKKVNSIGMYCFNKCESLQTIVMPEKIHTIDSVVVHNCPALTTIDFPGDLPVKGDMPIAIHCPSLKSFIFSESFQGKLSFAPNILRRHAVVKEFVEVDGQTVPNPQFINENGKGKLVFRDTQNAQSIRINFKMLFGILEGKKVVITGSQVLSEKFRDADGNFVAYFKSSDDQKIVFDPDEKDATTDWPSFAWTWQAIFREGGEYANSGISVEKECYNTENVFVCDGSANEKKLVKYLGRTNNELGEIVIPDDIYVIGKGAFEYCFATKITMGMNVERIEERAFYRCGELEEIDWAESRPLVIEKNAFGFCRKLRSAYAYGEPQERDGKPVFSLPRGLRRLGEQCFEMCESIAVLDLAETDLYELPPLSFRRCIGIEKIRYNRGMGKIDAKAFRGCTSILVGQLPQSIKSIGDSAFSFLMREQTITLPQNIKFVASNFLFYSTGVKEIFISPDAENYAVHENTLYTKENGALKEVVTHPINSKVESYQTPVGVTCVQAEAFRDLENLKTVTIGSDVEEIGANNFSYCWLLEEVVIGGNVKSVGEQCFSHNPKLRRVIIQHKRDLEAFAKNYKTLFCNNDEHIVIEWNGVEYVADDTQTAWEKVWNDYQYIKEKNI